MNHTGEASSGLAVSVIVPARRVDAELRCCLEGLRRLRPKPLEVILVADGPGLREDELAGGGEGGGEPDSPGLGAPGGLRVVRLAENGGPARARNMGAGLARGDILFFTDADVVLPPDAIGRVVETFRDRPDLAAVIGSYDDAPVGGFLSQYKNLFHHYVHQTSREDAGTFWGACGAIRRQTFLEIGGFDESYRWPSVEDIELGYRLKRAGCSIRLCKTLQVKHLKRYGAGSLLKSDFARRAVPWAELILRYRRLPNDLNLRWTSRLCVALAVALPLLAAGMLWRPVLGGLAGLAAALLLLLNWPLHRFFAAKRGLRFAAAAVGWHWFYYAYSGLGFAVGVIGFALRPRRGPVGRTSLQPIPADRDGATRPR